MCINQSMCNLQMKGTLRMNGSEHCTDDERGQIIILEDKNTFVQHKSNLQKDFGYYLSSISI